ncbi:hypothetical protein F4V57_01940 [Acinetobacter qingfengensis]|uniref:Uncharacterized protein n=1 Tax=Acinetobacter qingfengensis TaxID=1262585 RepID=A0A1E7R1S0_9GAMM|nr:hypothetical protein [Acinetobacter qingfengensis]KAA8735577.1 hypothetical protein F4V57_01940 [Acinetobacter qingfengensis]OEY93257.1 hypothetical protein BJI46_14385 [Acinetobacter qingfengensis]
MSFINPELVKSSIHVYQLRQICDEICRGKRWHTLEVENEIDKIRLIVALIDVMYHQGKLTQALILSQRTNVLLQMQSSFALHTILSAQMLLAQYEATIVQLCEYQQFFQKYGYQDLQPILQRFEIVVLDRIQHPVQDIFVRKLEQFYTGAVLQVSLQQKNLYL